MPSCHLLALKQRAIPMAVRPSRTTPSPESPRTEVGPFACPPLSPLGSRRGDPSGLRPALGPVRRELSPWSACDPSSPSPPSPRLPAAPCHRQFWLQMPRPPTYSTARLAELSYRGTRVSWPPWLARPCATAAHVAASAVNRYAASAICAICCCSFVRLRRPTGCTPSPCLVHSRHGRPSGPLECHRVCKWPSLFPQCHVHPPRNEGHGTANARRVRTRSMQAIRKGRNENG